MRLCFIVVPLIFGYKFSINIRNMEIGVTVLAIFAVAVRFIYDMSNCDGAPSEPQGGWRRIIHIDMDAFFAAVEQRDDASLRGVPIAVGYDAPRGVVSTASYEARRYGVRSAMPIARAKALCPGLRIVPCRFDAYKAVSAQIHEIFAEYTDLIEPLSIDEAFLDVTGNKAGIELGMDVAREIKDKIRARTSLTASAGVSYCKFLAKIASDYNKPDGLKVVHPLRALEFISGLPIEDFWGVGPRTAEKMHNLGISNGAQLRECTLPFLLSQFGKAGQVYYDFARGIDTRPVVAERVRKSIGCEETFLVDIYKPYDIEDEVNALLGELIHRLRRKQFSGHTLTLKVKYFDFTQITRSITSVSPLCEYEDIKPFVDELLSHIEYSKDRPIRLLGLSVSNPDAVAGDSGIGIAHPSLFGDDVF